MNMPSSDSGLRLDKWLWYARFFKTRSAATRLISGKKLRLNGEVMSKPHRQAQIGQTLTFPQANQIRLIQIDALGTRRGPASEAAELYTDLAPPEARDTEKKETNNTVFETRNPGAGRPTKKDRRDTQRLKETLE